jgi:hypothetical protein
LELGQTNLLAISPVRLAESEELEGRLVVIRPKPSTRGVRGFFDRFLYELAAKRLRLDDIGTFAWRHLDGQRTVAQIAELLREEFGEDVDPAEQRLGKLIWVLYREGFVSYPGFDD